jgi:Fe-S oxidoreductase
MNPTPSPELESLRHILTRDLQVLAKEVLATPDDVLWSTMDGVTNSVGTLSVHLCGNLRHFVGHLLGQDGYIRNRDMEFAGTPIPKQEVLLEIENTRAAVDQALLHLDPDILDDPMPSPPAHHEGRSVRFFLIQLSCHLSRHTGQVNYLRRILTATTSS